MNIFVLDESPEYAALAQHDRHIVKMIVESCQLLSTACQVDGAIADSYRADVVPWGGNLYKPTHVNHPCNVWVRESKHNFAWLTTHLHHLLAEYHRRWPGRTHACENLRFEFAALVGGWIHGYYTSGPDRKLTTSFQANQFAAAHTPFVYCGPDNFRARGLTDKFTDDEWVIESYRRYYLAEKAPGNRWTHPLYMPDWLTGHATIHLPESPAPSRAPRAKRSLSDQPRVDYKGTFRVSMPAAFKRKDS